MNRLFVSATLLLACHPVFAADPLVVAHRGASGDAPENTLPAFQLAWEQGANAIEGDFQLTSDGHIVCIHDKDTKRVAGKKRIVSQSTLAELRELDVGIYRGKQFRGTKIPTIEEVFATVHENKKIYIEIKCGPEILPPMLRAIQASKLEQDQIVVICFDSAVIAELKKAAPQFKACWLSGFKRNALGKVKPSLKTVLETLEKIDADGFSSTKSTIDEKFVKRVLDAGYEYHVWTVNEGKTAVRFANWGAMSITTDIPGEIRTSLFPEPRSSYGNP